MQARWRDGQTASAIGATVNTLLITAHTALTNVVSAIYGNADLVARDTSRTCREGGLALACLTLRLTLSLSLHMYVHLPLALLVQSSFVCFVCLRRVPCVMQLADCDLRLATI